MITKLIEEYAYLELPPDLANHSINQNILLCDYLDLWLERKKVEVHQTTFEGYTLRVEAIKKYFSKYNYRVKDITSRIIDA